MKATFISTQAITEATRLSAMKLQAKVAEAQKEVTTGRFTDVGMNLGYRTGETVSLRLEYTRLSNIVDANALVAGRLEATQATLTGVVGNAQGFISTLIAARSSSDQGPQIVTSEGQAGLKFLTEALNTSFGGAHLFAGINADVKPVSDYFSEPMSAARQAVADAFEAQFGFSQSDPQAKDIPAADMQAFLENAFADLFEGDDWTTNWSAASDQNVRSRISTYELIETSPNSNDMAFRKLASAYVMAFDLGAGNLNEATFKAVMDQAVKVTGEALGELAKVQANLGTAQQRVADANDRMSIQMNLMSTHINALESVDPYEAATRVNSLMTQIETAYALTARIQKLSLLNYL